ncbi:hypothetical protein HHK36_012801 [Tetracentron sinense]|uniref:LOB domain-containing protein n=1 Tax=Tetracentron sinense TaxID=13715 RepID=A0A835DJ08_TETSI|nr:hypothetical protein HHK36_012801 [Tetracentron sinense]
MTGFGSPCGACKFLRRKCVKGCVFAPCFCHEQGVKHFAAIHKVFGASNVSKLLAHLPVSDRCEAAVTISYEAQARLQDPVYGCVSHIYELQQQVVNLQTQLASLKAQAAQSLINGSTTTSSLQEDKFYSKVLSYPQEVQSLFHSDDSNMVQQFHPNPSNNVEEMLFYDSGIMDLDSISDNSNSVMPEGNVSFSGFEDPSHAMTSLDMQTNSRKWAFQDSEDLHSVAFAYLHEHS